MKRPPIISVLRVLRDRRGVSVLMVAMSLVVLVGMAAFVIDLGHAVAVQRDLQASADAAALAGAQDLDCCVGNPNQAISTAIAYSAVAGGKNASPNLAVTMPTGYPKLMCFKSTGLPCNGPSGANGIVVQQQTTVTTWFAPILGITSIPIAVTSTASVSGGMARPLDVMLVLDTTDSMNDPDPSCSIPGATKIECAMAGVRTILQTLAPSADQIGLMVFPGLTNANQAQYDYSCNATNPQVAPYKSSPVYEIVPLSSNYRTSNSATTLNPASDLALASQGIASCPEGVKVIGGEGTYFAAAISDAQATLVDDGQANTQKVIILLSDGDANSRTTPANEAKNQCHQAITAAETAAAAGTWVYSIAYDASTSPTPGSCSTDSPPISACSTMQQIASDPSKFYSDTFGDKSSCTSAAQSVSELVSLFQSLAYSLLPPRLIPNDTN